MARQQGKIAVVLIHGIGDQRPMATLRSFIEAVLQPDPQKPHQPLYWSKPDMLSPAFGLRRYHAPAGRKRPPTDFYEYYWAHKMEGNALSHTLQWVNNLLLRWPVEVPARLRNLWWLCWAVLIVTLLTAIALWRWTPAGAVGVLGAMALAGGKLAMNSAARDWVGDAARYFDDRPANVGVRDAIRRGGVELLDKIHESGEYRRVIVVGHSLGSAIALDLLYYYWTGVRERHASPDRPDQSALFALETLLRGPEAPSAAQIRSLQKQIWQEMRANGASWRVSDLITLGSPLAHLPFLTRLTEQQFRQRLSQRELPTCPPVLDGKGIAYWTRYRTEAGDDRSIATLHHAACFAPTRWTNLFFAHDGWFGGDPVGGPLAGLFGSGVDDRVVATHHWRGRFNHLDYWLDDPRDAGLPNAPLAVLRACLSLDEGFGPTRRAPSPTPQAH